MGRAAFLVLACGLLAGCQTKPIQALSYTELSALGRQIEERCIAQGVRRGTRNFDTCVRQEADREVYQRAANRRTMRNIGQAMQNAADNAPKHTTCTRAWNTVNCTTF